MLYFCCNDERRRNEIARRNDLNAIDFLEVEEDQTLLFVHFVHDPTGLGLVRANVQIEGGERIQDIHVVQTSVGVDARSGSSDPVLVVEVNTPGDFSIYTLRLIAFSGSPLTGLDPVLRAIDFSFKVSCETKFDPLQSQQCAPEPHSEPPIDYLARDYLSLRQLMLDRLAVTLPDWQERNPADTGVALVELLAYIGDQLSYRQDAVATEAYLGTCRLRTSARRHARLVDYLMHDGRNARTWVSVRVAEGTTAFVLKDAAFYCAVPGLPAVIRPGTREADRIKQSGSVAFQQMAPVTLAPEHNEMYFYAWGSRQCCLPKGAVRATLRGHLANLKPGMLLVFVEARSPRTGNANDANLANRCAVRLTNVWFDSDPLGGRFALPPSDDPLDVTEISWSEEDALPFPVCISAETSQEDNAAYVENISVALGNIVLADHGGSVMEYLELVPEDMILQALPLQPVSSADPQTCTPNRVQVAHARYRPYLRNGPLSQAGELDFSDLSLSASRMMLDAGDILPSITLDEQMEGGAVETWKARLDLLSSRAEDAHFVVEVEADGSSRLRFGDGKHGRRPTAGTRFSARYRIGNGVSGNVGANTLVHCVSSESSITAVTNPLPASGGIEMESIEEVRQSAPFAFRPQTLPGQPDRPDGRTLGRAVTPADYAAVTETNSLVQRAAASFRWTGSWRTVSVTVDRLGGGPVSQKFANDMRQYLEKYRLSGHDLEVEPPRPVALEVIMRVRIKPGYFASHVRRKLLDIFSNRALPDGRRGVFHPDNLTFGQTIYLSPLYAAAQSVDGVESAVITTFQRRDRPSSAALEDGRLTMGRLEIARMDNDPNFPERGTFTLRVEGGG
jgi:hypothetical protein